jgi:hypothetical protein
MEKNARLYVVFQGLISLVEYTDRYVAYVVHDEDDVHRSAFGHWLCETSLPCEDTALLLDMGKPFAPEGAGLSADRTLILKEATTPKFPQPQACDTRIFLPRPHQIHYYSHKAVGADYFSDPTQFRVGSDGKYHYSVFRVFEYHLTERQLENAALTSGLKKNLWVSRPYFAGNHLVDVLHLFAEPEVGGDPPPGHGRKEFTMTCGLLGQPALALTKADGLPMPKKNMAEGDQLPDGLVWQEIIPLYERDAHVTRLITHWLRSGTRKGETDNKGVPTSNGIPDHNQGTSSYCGGPDGGGGDYGEDVPAPLREVIAELTKE